MKLLCIVLSVIMFLFFYIDKLFFYLYYFQLNGYNVKSILYNHFELVKRSIVYFIVSLIFFCCVLFSEFNLLWVEFVFYLCWCLLSCFYLVGYKFYKKIKYTKRMIRLCICNLFLLLLYLAVIVFLFRKNLILFLFCCILFSFIFILLSAFIMLPIEKIISNYYIKLAKSKINSLTSLIKIGITGSYGKTSTKIILNAILSEYFNSYATEKSFNTPLGISRSINYGLTHLHEIFVCEMGAKSVGEIAELCNFVNVDIGVVTSVGRQHLQTFGCVENVYNTKKELPDFLSGKLCVFNLNNLYTRLMYDEYVGDKIGVCVISKNKKNLHSIIKKYGHLLACKTNICFFKIFYQYPSKEVVFAKKISADEFGLKFKVYQGKNYLFECCSKLLGIHNITNILLSIAVALRLKVPVNKIQAGVLKVNGIEARLERMICSNGAIVINNGYNANLDSSKSTLAVLDLFNRKHKVVITPGLIECDDMYGCNVVFGELISKFATEVVIVKEINKKAITEGLINKGFDINKIIYVSGINDCKNIIDNADKDYIFLIENDLPGNFR